VLHNSQKHTCWLYTIRSKPGKNCHVFWLITEYLTASSTSDTPSLHRQFFFALLFLPDILTFRFTRSACIISDSLKGLWAINGTECKGWKSNCRCKLCNLWSHLVHCNHPLLKASKTLKLTLCFTKHATFTELCPSAIKWIVLYEHASNLTVPFQASKVHILPQRGERLRETWKS